MLQIGIAIYMHILTRNNIVGLVIHECHFSFAVESQIALQNMPFVASAPRD